MILVLFSVITIKSNSAYAICAATPTVMVAGSGTDLAGLCSAISAGATEISTASIDSSTTATAVSTDATAYDTYLLYLKQTDAYAKQVLQYQEQVLQVERFISDLEENPLNAIVPNADKLIANQVKIDNLAKDIANNSSNIAANAMKDLEHPDSIGLGMGSKFALWSEARRKNAEESYKIVTDLVKDASKKNKAITDVIKNADKAQGQTATQKALANAAVQQLSLLQEIGDSLNKLMGGQAIENGIKYNNDIIAAQALNKVATEAPGAQLTLPPDSYLGPGKSGSNKGF